MNVIIGTIKIKFPDLGFAFNPIRVLIEGYTINDSIVLESNNIKIEREAIDGNVSFELSAIARSMFNRLDFYKAEEVDTSLFKVQTFTLSNKDGDLYTGTIPVLWGALQIGELYSQSKTLTYFKGFPFTVPLYTDNEIVLKANGVEYKTLEAGKYNLDISDLSSLDNIEIGLFYERHYKIFDFTFNSTFGPERVLVPKNLSIKIKVVDCPNDGVYLRWINKYGEYNYYLFQSGAISSTTKNNAISYDNVYYTTDLTDNYHHGTGKSIGKDIENNQKLFASLIDSNTYDLLIGLVESPVVDVLIGYTWNNHPEWVSVTIADGTFTKTRSNLQDFELSLIPNKKAVQTL